MDLGVSGQVGLVVGGAGYVGSAITERLRAEGMTTIVGSRHVDPGPESLVLDGGDDDSVDAALQQVLADHGRVDALVVTAAPSARTLDPDRAGDPAQVIEAVDAKAMTFLRLANAVLPHMTRAGYGRVVGIGGHHAWITASITASVRNAALLIAAKNLADGCAGTGVTVNAVNPGLVTDDPEDQSDELLSVCTPTQVADLVAFLASPLGGGLSGESIAVGHRQRGVVVF